MYQQINCAKIFLVLLTVFGALLESHVAWAKIPEGLNIVSTSGDGCPKEAVTAFFVPSANYLYVLPGDFKTNLARRVPGIAKVSTCKIRLSMGLKANEGIQVEEAQFDGKLNLLAGAKAYLHTELFLDEKPDHLLNATLFEGPQDGFYRYELPLGQSDFLTSCGQSVHLNVQVNLILNNRLDASDLKSEQSISRIRIPLRMVNCPSRP